MGFRDVTHWSLDVDAGSSDPGRKWKKKVKDRWTEENS